MVTQLTAHTPAEVLTALNWSYLWNELIFFDELKGKVDPNFIALLIGWFVCLFVEARGIGPSPPTRTPRQGPPTKTRQNIEGVVEFLGGMVFL